MYLVGNDNGASDYALTGVSVSRPNRVCLTLRTIRKLERMPEREKQVSKYAAAASTRVQEQEVW